MPETRFFFEKLGRSAYISHLDLMRTFQRAFLRAGAVLRHSEGFNPHPRMSIVLPLQLGCESVCEALDAELLSGPAELLPALNRALPEGIRVRKAAPPRMKASALRFARWELRFAAEAEAEEAAFCLQSPSLPVEKKTKRGVVLLDIAPHTRLLAQTGATLTVVLSTAEPSVNTGDVLRALAHPAPATVKCRRTAVYTQSMEEFC